MVWGSLSSFYFVSWESGGFQAFLHVLSYVSLAFSAFLAARACWIGHYIGLVDALPSLVPATLYLASAPAQALQTAVLVVIAGIRIYCGVSELLNPRR